MKLSRTITFLQYAFILALPFFQLFWLNPAFLGEHTIGNDYSVFHIDHQIELQYSLKRGSFPLYAPGFAGGRSTAALTLGQLYHPLPHIAALTPGYWEGAALKNMTFWRLVSLGLTQLILFVLLRRLKVRADFSFVISFITVYNLRMLDLFRYGSSLENYLAFLWLSAFMAIYYLKPTRVLGPAAIIGSTYLLICGGHPQMMYLGLLGAGIVGLILPHTLAAISPDVSTTWQSTLRFYRNMAIFLLAGIVMSAAYILPLYYEFILENAERVGKGYRWSLAYADSWGGTVNSFFRPLYSVVNSAFGSSSLIVLTLMLPLAFLVRRRVPRVMIFMILAYAFVFFVGLGEDTPVHFFFWKYFPLANTFRTPGRINMILPVLFLFILAWLLKPGGEWSETRRRWMIIPPAVVLALLALGLYIYYNTILVKSVPEPAWYIPFRIKRYPGWVDEYAYILGLATLILLVLRIAVRNIRPAAVVLGLLLSVSVMLQCGLQMRYGTWLIESVNKPTLATMDSQKAQQLGFRGLPGFGMDSRTTSRQIEESALDPLLARFYRSYKTVKTQEDAYDYLATKRTPSEAVVETSRAAKERPRCPASNPSCGFDTVSLKESSYNRMLFEVNATEDGLFTLSYPFSGRWIAAVDGKEAGGYRANGYLMGVFMPKGRHTVALRYWSPSVFAGILISLLTLVGVVVYFAFAFKRWAPRIAVSAVAVLLAGGVLFAWYHSLWHGDNLNTRYEWKSNRFAPEDNLAFGRKATMSSIKSIERPYVFYAGKAVDGDTQGGAFATADHVNNGWWQVDLGSRVELDRMVIIDTPSRTSRDYLPIKVLVSDYEESFREILTLDTRPPGRTWTIELHGAEARIIRLQSSSKKTSFSLNEVEVYGN